MTWRIGAAGPFIVSQSPGDSSPAPFIPQDWPLLSKPKSAGGIEVAASLLLTTLAVAVTVVPREPLYHTPPKQPAPFAYVVPNLLTSTLAPAAVAAAPFKPLDQPLLRIVGRLFPYEPLNLLTSTLAPAAAAALMPSTPLDLGVPPANLWRGADVYPNRTLRSVPFRPLISEPLRSVVGTLWDVPQNLLTSTLAATPVAVPFKPLEYSLPRGPAQLFAFEPQNLVISAVTPAQAVPFTPQDWPPLPKVRWTQSYEVPNLLTSVFSQPLPFSQHDWPPPFAQARPIAEAPAGANLALLTAAPPVPFSQLNWPQLPVPVAAEPFLIPNTTIRQVAPTTPPNIHKLYIDLSTGRLYWQVSTTANPIEILPL